jgi:hypothetical protein
VKKQFINLIGSAILVLAASSVLAADVYTYNVTGQYGGVRWIFNPAGSVSAEITIEGLGHDRRARLRTTTYGGAMGYSNWHNYIPVDAVTVQGVSSMTVELDTCSVVNEYGCGYVNFTLETTQPASGFHQNGVVRYDFGDVHERYVGDMQVRNAAASGEIVGVPVSNTNSWIGKFTDVEIEIEVGQ